MLLYRDSHNSKYYLDLNSIWLAKVKMLILNVTKLYLFTHATIPFCSNYLVLKYFFTQKCLKHLDTLISLKP